MVIKSSSLCGGLLFQEKLHVGREMKAATTPLTDPVLKILQGFIIPTCRFLQEWNQFFLIFLLIFWEEEFSKLPYAHKNRDGENWLKKNVFSTQTFPESSSFSFRQTCYKRTVSFTYAKIAFLPILSPFKIPIYISLGPLYSRRYQ